MKANAISRRECLAVAASAAAFPAVSASPEYSRMGELIADWEMANEEATFLSAEADRIFAAAQLPAVGVSDGARRFRYPCQVHDAFDRRIDAWQKDRLQAEFAPAVKARRDALIAELERQEAALIEAERACGFTAAEALADAASWRAWAIRTEIFAHRPVTMAEVEARNAFVLRQIAAGSPPDKDELNQIFGSATGGANAG